MARCKIKQYDRENIQKMTISQLRALCEEHNIDPDDLIGRNNLKSTYIYALEKVTLSNGKPLIRKPVYTYLNLVGGESES